MYVKNDNVNDEYDYDGNANDDKSNSYIPMG